MVSVENIQKLVEEKIVETDLFVVEIKVDTANNISVFMDAPKGVDVQHCINISRHIEEALDREEEDFSLEVSSSGIGQPFKVLAQYKKAINRTVEVLFTTGKKVEGVLLDANSAFFVLEHKVKEKAEGSKRPKLVDKKQEIKYDEVKSVIETIKF